MSWLDNYDVCEEWGSEELIIPYRSEVDGKIHRYFPDFVAKMRQPDGTKKILLLEVKPHSQTLVPVIKKSKRKKTMMNEIATYSVNQSKWAAARAFCEDRGWEFKVLTEYDLGILNK